MGPGQDFLLILLLLGWILASRDPLVILVRLLETEPQEKPGVISYCEIQASGKNMKLIQGKIEKLMAEILELAKDDDDEDPRRYRLTLAFFPLDKTPPGNK